MISIHFHSFWCLILVHFIHFHSTYETRFFLFWLNFVNWTLVGIFCSILIHLNDWFWPIWFILIHFDDSFWSIWTISVTKFSLFYFILLILDDFSTFCTLILVHLTHFDDQFCFIWVIFMIHFGPFGSFRWSGSLYFASVWYILTIDFSPFDSFWFILMIHFGPCGSFQWLSSLYFT